MAISFRFGTLQHAFWQGCTGQILPERGQRGGGGHICSSASAQQLRGGRQLPDLAHYLGNAGPEVVVDLLQGDARVIHSVMQQRCHDCRLNPAHTELAFLSCNTSYLH